MGCGGSSIETKENNKKMKKIENERPSKARKSKKKEKVHSVNSYGDEKSYYRINNKIYQNLKLPEGQKKDDNASEEIVLKKENENFLEEKIVPLKLNDLNNHEENEKNVEKKKTKKKNKKKTKRIDYEKKLEELREKEKKLNERKIKITKDEKKLKKENGEYLKKENKFKDMKKAYDIEKKTKDSELLEREKKLKKKEEELQKLEDKYFPKIKPILIGLNNIGATCYMNASLQCLSNTKELTEFFLNKFKEKDKNKQIMSHQYHRVIRHLWDEKSNNNPYSPNPFKEVLSKENPLFAGIAANDSKDLINFLIERLHQELNEINDNNNSKNDDSWAKVNQANESEVLKLFTTEFTSTFNSIISELFYGISETKSQCQGCSIIKYNFQVYSFLEFPLQQVNQFYFNNGKRPLFTNDGKNPDVDLYECFEYYRKIDLMTGENQMYCNICNNQCNSSYATYLYTGPNYLTLHLNRGRGAVYECKVLFPERLNLFNYITYKEGGAYYELYAVICHLGPSSMSGHFVAYCRNRMDNQWYLYNDGMVSLCTRTKQYTDGMPYILFYRIIKSND